MEWEYCLCGLINYSIFKSENEYETLRKEEIGNFRVAVDSFILSRFPCLMTYKRLGNATTWRTC